LPVHRVAAFFEEAAQLGMRVKVDREIW